MTQQRITELEKRGFEWEIRSTVPRKAVPKKEAPVPQAGQPAQPEDFNLVYQNL